MLSKIQSSLSCNDRVILLGNIVIEHVSDIFRTDNEDNESITESNPSGNSSKYTKEGLMFYLNWSKNYWFIFSFLVIKERNPIISILLKETDNFDKYIKELMFYLNWCKKLLICFLFLAIKERIQLFLFPQVGIC